MANKRGFELSLNLIIMVILALVFLGVAIAFIVKFLPNEFPQPPSKCEVYPPTAGSPVCVNDEYELSRGDTIQMKVAFYNDEDADITSTVVPMITCGNNVDGGSLNPKVSATGKNLEIGTAEDYLLIVNVPKDSPRGTYPCTLRLSSTEESFSMVVQ